MSNLKAGDHVRYIGTAEQDIYHGELVGKEGVLTEAYRLLWFKAPYEGKLYPKGMYLWSVDLSLLELVA